MRFIPQRKSIKRGPTPYKSDFVFFAPFKQDLRGTPLGKGSHVRSQVATYFDKNGILQSAAANKPRVTYQDSIVGLLHEGTGMNNLEVDSEDLTSSGWSASECSVGGSTTGPDGSTITKNGLIADTDDEAHQVTMDADVSVYNGPNNDITISAFVKAGDRDWCRLAMQTLQSDRSTAIATKGCYFDLANVAVGTASSGVTGRIYTLGNGWYRIAITYTVEANAYYVRPFLQLANADNDSDFAGDGVTVNTYFWGIQAEQTFSWLTSYMPSSGYTEVDDETGVTAYQVAWNNNGGLARLTGLDLTTHVASPYKRIVFHDSNGKKAAAWISEADAAEALGAELVTSGDMASDTGWTLEGNWAIGGGTANNPGSGTNFGEKLYPTLGSLTNGKLYKFVYEVVSQTGVTAHYLGSSSCFSAGAISLAYSVGTHTYYFTCIDDGANLHFGAINSGSQLEIDNVSLKEVTHVGTDGVHLVKGRFSTARGFEYVQPAFNANLITSLEVETPDSVQGRGSEQDYPQWTMSAELLAALASGGEGTLFCELIPLYNPADMEAGNQGLVSSTASGGSLLYTHYSSGHAYFDAHDATTLAYVLSDYVLGDVCRLAVHWGSGKFRIGVSVNGGAWTWGTEANYDGSFTTTGNLLRIGQDNEHPFIISRLVIHSRKYTTNQIEAKFAS